MNVIVAPTGAGVVETAGSESRCKAAMVRASIAPAAPRCVETTPAQEDLPEDRGVLRALVPHIGREVLGRNPFPCAGVYAVIALRSSEFISLGFLTVENQFATGSTDNFRILP